MQRQKCKGAFQVPRHPQHGTHQSAEVFGLGVIRVEVRHGKALWSQLGVGGGRFGQKGPFQQMCHHFGIGFADGVDALLFEMETIPLGVFDNAVVNQGQFSVIRQVWVGICAGYSPVGGPAGVTDRGGGLGKGLFFEARQKTR